MAHLLHFLRRLMKTRPSLLIAVALLLVAIAWLWSGRSSNALALDTGASPTAPLLAAGQPTTVRFIDSVARRHQRTLAITGETAVNQTVTVRAETTGRIIATDIEENLPVRRGQIIAKLAPQNRSESLAEAQALLKQRHMEHEAAQRLAT